MTKGACVNTTCLCGVSEHQVYVFLIKPLLPLNSVTLSFEVRRQLGTKARKSSLRIIWLVASGITCRRDPGIVKREGKIRLNYLEKNKLKAIASYDYITQEKFTFSFLCGAKSNLYL